MINYYKEELTYFFQIPTDKLESTSQDDTEAYKQHHYLIDRKNCSALVAIQGESPQVSTWKAESDVTEKIFPGEAFRFMWGWFRRWLHVGYEAGKKEVTPGREA